ncbi:transcriptional regulator [Myxococcus stipitatus DSM 14675]|uniref:Transcriptional regulator n=1 Tax=Myxococcus stipitatus (strain DSM 14675 / JCM 12634 / Mx s8) TaxID=1278073 RepID=L7UNQ7_MYXSD|nr:helix-turn-helix domain-containing protein [Myxococcus stipitatus]AGC48114.1 transcriptional regulator [Myxococcus stipitatus DSM 14675]
MSLKQRKSKAPPPPPGCPMRTCMSLLGGVWTPNVIWHLSGGPRRFGELIKDIPGISPKVLTTRLRELEAKGAVAREVQPTSPPSVEYALSELGMELVPVIDAIVRVGTRLKHLNGGQYPEEATRSVKRRAASAT